MINKNKKTAVIIIILTLVVFLLSGCNSESVRGEVRVGRGDIKYTATTDIIAEEDGGKIEIVMVGDVLLHTPVSESGKMEDGTYNYDHLFANVKEKIQEADIAIVNQEVILGGRELGLSGYPNFNGAYEVGDAIIEAGFDVVLHATNHALDKGREGVVNCLNYWKRNPKITVCGINGTKEERDTVRVVEAEGARIAILNYTYGTNGMLVPSDMPYVINMLDKNEIEKDVALAKQISDFVIACPHWGTEYIHTVSDEQRYWTNVFAQCGVDLVIGTHPHVIEPYEEIQRPDGGTMYVYYSLGNFINMTAESGSGTADRMVGAMADVTLAKDKNKVKVEKCEAIPLVTQMKKGTGMVTTYFLSDYTKELADENEIKERDSAFSLEYCNSLFASVLGE